MNPRKHKDEDLDEVEIAVLKKTFELFEKDFLKMVEQSENMVSRREMEQALANLRDKMDGNAENIATLFGQYDEIRTEAAKNWDTTKVLILTVLSSLLSLGMGFVLGIVFGG